MQIVADAGQASDMAIVLAADQTAGLVTGLSAGLAVGIVQDILSTVALGNTGYSLSAMYLHFLDLTSGHAPGPKPASAGIAENRYPQAETPKSESTGSMAQGEVPQRVLLDLGYKKRALIGALFSSFQRFTAWQCQLRAASQRPQTPA